MKCKNSAIQLQKQQHDNNIKIKLKLQNNKRLLKCEVGLPFVTLSIEARPPINLALAKDENGDYLPKGGLLLP